MCSQQNQFNPQGAESEVATYKHKLLTQKKQALGVEGDLSEEKNSLFCRKTFHSRQLSKACCCLTDPQ